MLIKGNVFTAVDYNDVKKRITNYRRYGSGSNYSDSLAGFTTTSSLTITDVIEVTKESLYGAQQGSVFFDGTDDRADLASTTCYLGANDFTVEAWVYWAGNTALSSVPAIITKWSSSNGPFQFLVNATGFTFQYTKAAGGQLGATGTTAPSANRWYHVAAVKYGSELKLYVDGVLEATTTGATAILNRNDNVQIGHRTWAGPPPVAWDGYISNLRLSNIARYTADFLPSSSPPVSDSNTILLTCQGSLNDNGPDSLTITPQNGPVPSTVASPFDGYYVLTTESNVIRTESTSNLSIKSELLSGKNYQIIERKNNKYFIGTNDGYLYSSDDAVTWTDISSGLQVASINWGTTNNTSKIYSIEYARGYYVVCGYVRMAYSKDLSTWVNARDIEDYYGTTGSTGYFSNLGLRHIDGVEYYRKVRYLGEPKSTEPFLGAGSISFDGSGDYVDIASSSDFIFDGDFTIEYWIYREGGNVWFDLSNTSDYTNAIQFYSSSGNFHFYMNSSTATNVGGAGYMDVPTNQWVHHAVSRSGTTCRVFADGVLKKTTTLSGTAGNNANNILRLGAQSYGGPTAYFQGKLSNLRIVKGTALYTKDFIPPTTALNDISGTVLLCCQGYDGDKSASAHTLSFEGNATTIGASGKYYLPANSNVYYTNDISNPNASSNWSKVLGYHYADIFAETADQYWDYFYDRYSALGFRNYGVPTNNEPFGGAGAVQFDGLGKALTFPAGSDYAYGTGDFTIEGWFYPTVIGTVSGALGPGHILYSQAVSGTNWLLLFVDENGKPGFYNTSSGGGTDSFPSIPNGSVVENQWQHIALCRDSGTLRLFVNGTQLGTVSNSFNFSSSYNPCIANYAHALTSSPYNGYISNFRIVKGTALYTEDFTPQTTPFEIVPNTVLLTCKGDNPLEDQSLLNTTITAVGNPPAIQPTNRLVAMKGYGGYNNTMYNPVAFSTSVNSYPSHSSRLMKWEEFTTPSGGPVGIKTIFGSYPPLSINRLGDNTYIMQSTISQTGGNSRVAITTDFVTYTNKGYGLASRVAGVGYGYTYGVYSGSQTDNDVSFDNADMAIMFQKYMLGSNYTLSGATDSAYNPAKNRTVLSYWTGGNNYHYSGYVVGVSTNNGTSWMSRQLSVKSSYNTTLHSKVISGIGNTDYFVLGAKNSSYGPFFEVSENGDDWYATNMYNYDTMSSKYGVMSSGSYYNGNYLAGFTDGKLLVSKNPGAEAKLHDIPVNPNNSLEPDSLVLFLPLNTARTTNDICGIMTTHVGYGANKTVTNNNSVSISSTISKYYGSSAQFNGTNQYLSIADQNDLDFGTGDFTCEAWVYVSGDGTVGAGSPNGRYFFSKKSNSTFASTDWVMRYNVVDDDFGFTCGSSGALSITSTAVEQNRWYHVAATRESGTVRLFVDGVLQDSGTFSGSLSNSNNLLIGFNQGSNNAYFEGNMNDLRIYKGYAKYTTNFAPPKLGDYFQYLTFSAPLDTVNSESSLTYENTYDLSAGIGSTVTMVKGNGVSVRSEITRYTGVATHLHGVNAGIGTTVFSAELFVNAGTATTIDASVYKYGSSSVRFTGASNSDLTGPVTGFGTTDFTISFFYYAQGTGQNYYNTPYEQRPAGSQGNYSLLYSYNNGPMRYHKASADRITGTTNLSTGTWYHICVQRNSGVTRLFVDGTQEGSDYADSGSYDEQRILLGQLSENNSYNSNMNLDDMVVWNGVANYAIGAGNTIQVPTTQYDYLTDPNKNYLVFASNFEDAVGTSNITYTTKRQRGIAYFNAGVSFTNDGIRVTGVNTTPQMSLGNDDYTIEFWTYQNFDDRRLNSNNITFVWDMRDSVKTTSPRHYINEYCRGNFFLTNEKVVSYHYDLGIFGSENSNVSATLGITTNPKYDTRSGLETWHHIAASRKDGIVYHYVDGKLRGAYDDVNNHENTQLVIGSYYASSNYTYNGYMQAFQIYKGVAKYYPSYSDGWTDVLDNSYIAKPSFPYNRYVWNMNSKKVDGKTVHIIPSSGNGRVAIATDALFDNVGSAKSVYVDYAVTNGGGVGIGTTSAYGVGSLYMNGTTNSAIDLNYVNFRGATQYGYRDFTIEMWVNIDDFSISRSLYCERYTSSAVSPYIYTGAGGVIYYYLNGNRITGPTLNANQWYHIAVCRENSVTRMYVDGTQVGSDYADTNNYYTYNINGAGAALGSVLYTGTVPMKGYFNGLRVYRGYAKYTSNFTPSATALTSDGDENKDKLYILANFNTTGDLGISTTNGSIIPYEYYGSKRHVGFSTITKKLIPSTDFYNTSRNSVGLGTTSKFGTNSAYFDEISYFRFNEGGIPITGFGESPFSIEFWMYPHEDTLTGSTHRTIFDGRRNASNGNTFRITLYNGTLYIYLNNSAVNTVSNISANVWQHILIQRVVGSNNVLVFLDGVKVSSFGSVTFKSDSQSSTRFYDYFIGSNYSGTEEYKGHLEDFRIYNGHAPYPVSLSTLTDSFIVGGNIQISTGSSAYGGSSLYSDGTSGNYLNITNTPLDGIGTGDYTIEGWFNSTSTNTQRAIQIASNTNGYAQHMLYRTGTTYSYYSAPNNNGWTISNQQFGTSFADNTWVHLAIERYNGTNHLYVNGVGVNTFTNTNSYPTYTGPLRISTYNNVNQPWVGYMQDVRFYDKAKYQNTPFTPPTSWVDPSTETNVAMAASFQGTNGQTNIDYQEQANTITVPTASLTGVGNTLTFLANLKDNDNFEYTTYNAIDPFDAVVSLPSAVNSITGVEILDDQFVVNGAYGYVAVSTDGYKWNMKSRRVQQQQSTIRGFVGISSLMYNLNTYMYDVVGYGSTIIMTGEYNNQASKHIFYSEDEGADEFNNLWHGSSAERHHRGGSDFQFPETGGQSISRSQDGHYLLANSYGTRNGYGDYAINFSSGVTTTGFNSGNNWPDYTPQIPSLIKDTGKVTKVKSDGDKTYIIAYDSTTSEGSWYKVGILTNYLDTDSMKICAPSYKEMYGVAFSDNDTAISSLYQYPSRLSLQNSIVSTSGPSLRIQNYTQTQKEYLEDPYKTAFTSSADGINVSIAASFSTASFGEKFAPTVDTGVYKYGTASWKFGQVDGLHGQMIQAPEMNLGWYYGDWQIEFWIYVSSSVGTVRIFNFSNSYYLDLNATTIRWISPGGTKNIGTLSTSQWYHVAVSRRGGIERTFLDGTQIEEYDTSIYTYEPNTTYGYSIGGRYDGKHTSDADDVYYLDDIRVYTGYAGYTTSFTAPASQLSFASSDEKEKIVFFSNCENNTEWTTGLNPYYSTGIDHGLTNLRYYYPPLQGASNTYYDTVTKITGYFKPKVVGIHTFSFGTYRNANLWFNNELVVNTYYNRANTNYTTQSLSTTTYYPIEIWSNSLRESTNGIEFTYINADSNGVYSGDFSEVGFSTAGPGATGVSTIGFAVRTNAYFDSKGTSFELYRNEKLKGIVKGDNGYVYYGENGFVGFSTDNVTIENFQKSGYQGLDQSIIGAGKQITNVFGTNDILCGIYTNSQYILTGSGPKVAISTNGTTWEDKTSVVSAGFSGMVASSIPSVGISSSGSLIFATSGNAVAISTDLVTFANNAGSSSYSTSTFSNPGTTPVEISTTQSKFGNGAAYFAPTASNTSYLQASFTDVIDGDYTIEWWAYQDGTNYGYPSPFEWGTYSNSILNTGGSWYLTSGSGAVQGQGSYNDGTGVWKHFALVRYGGAIYWYNGDGTRTILNSSSAAGTFNPSNDIFRISAPQWANGNWAGYLNDFVFYKGIAKYTGASYTAPTTQYDIDTDPYASYVMFAAPFTGSAGSTTINYFHNYSIAARTGFDKTFTAGAGIGTHNILADNVGRVYSTDDALSGITTILYDPSAGVSTSQFYDVKYGDVQISTASSAYGGSSAYFDGASVYDVLKINQTPLDGVGTGDYTIEGWFNALDNGNSVSGRWAISEGHTGSTYANNIFYRYQGNWYYYSSSNGSSWNAVSGANFGAVADNTWVHLCAMRKNGIYYIFKDGTLVTSGANTNSYTTSGRPTYIGSRTDGNSQNHYGYMQDLVITKSAFRPTTGFTPQSTFTPSLFSGVDLYVPFNSTYGLNSVVDLTNPSSFGNKSVTRLYKSGNYLVGLADGGYFGYSLDGKSWSSAAGYNGNLTGFAYNGISTDPKYSITTDEGQIYISGIN